MDKVQKPRNSIIISYANQEYVTIS
jgi:hypothetical protein